MGLFSISHLGWLRPSCLEGKLEEATLAIPRSAHPK
jgi:hypothetical protein